VTDTQNITYRVAIVGAGPAGLSAGARAAELDRAAGRSVPTHIVLEAFERCAKTIQRYQKGKLVMAEPGFLDLRSDLRFGVGSREEVLSQWMEDYERVGVNLRLGASVQSVSGAQGNFALKLTNGATVRAECIVLAIGIEGNPRKIGSPGEDLQWVQYQLDDPKEYRDETILVVGAGDAAIENALALTEQNKVFLVNRGKEFSRAKQANLTAVLTALAQPRRRLGCYYETRVKMIAARVPQGLAVTLETPTGPQVIECDRVIARLGADPPRRFVESLGIRFPTERVDALPQLSKRYESNVPGIYVIGSLAGYPLIKQAMNQGYDVAEYVYGNQNVRPVDQQLVEWQFGGIPFFADADAALERFKNKVPMFRGMNALAFRELIIESTISVAYREGQEYEDEARKQAALQESQVSQGRQPRATRIVLEGSVIYEPGDYGTSFFTIVQGSVTLENPDNPALSSELNAGDFFGEISLLSGRPRLERATAGAACVLVETPRRVMIKLMSSNEDARRAIDRIFVVRELQRHFAPKAPLRLLQDIASRIEVKRYKAGESVFQQGDKGDSLFIVRSGGLTLFRKDRDSEMAIAQVPAGDLFGEMALMGDPVRRDTAKVSLASELIELKRAPFLDLMKLPGAPVEELQRTAAARAAANARVQVQPGTSAMMAFLMAQGLGEATDVLVINETTCIGCDNCEKACAETHDGISRLNRKEGGSFANVHVPVACRHCDQPHCMKDCPPNAIRRSPSGEVYINESCIGCGNCQNNCPYGVIRMVHEAPRKPGLLSWLMFGAGPGPGEPKGLEQVAAAGQHDKKRAVKCDACISVANGPACVKACPTGAARRISPADYVTLIQERRT
jgi:Fe-S-cluster-containing hydrogenase component 2/thioredoxin reductase/CRP-like cAMP-binding protein